MESCMSTPLFRTSDELDISDTFSNNLIEPESTRQEKNQVYKETQQELILSIAWRSGKLGAAYYDRVSHELHAIADIVETSGDQHSILRGLFYQIQPATLILKYNLDEERLRVITQLVGLSPPLNAKDRNGGSQYDDEEIDRFSLSEPDDDENNGRLFNNKFAQNASDRHQQPSVGCRLHFVPSSFFKIEVAKRKLMSLHLQSQLSFTTETERHIYMKSTFPLECPAVVQATGALLQVLERWNRGQDTERLNEMSLDSCLTVSSIRIHRLDDLVWMDQTAFLSLKIFSQESHPSNFKRGQASSAKEGLSLFGIASKCYSTPGFVHLRNLFLRPTRNIQTLNERYSVIRFCKQSSNVETVQSFIACLKNISNIKVTLSNISIMQGTVNDWKKLLTTTRNMIALSSICQALPQDIALFRQLASCQKSSHLHHIANVVNRIINFEESKKAGRCVLNYGVDDDLDQLKRNFSNMPRIYKETVAQEIDDLPSYVKQGVIEFLPEIGHCLCLASWLPEGQPITPEVLNELTKSLPGLTLQFYTNGNLYFKSTRCRDLDSSYGDFEAEIMNFELSLMLSASNCVIERSEPLVQGIELAGYLDALLSLTSFSMEFEMVQPELVEDTNSQITIENGRHVLLQMVVDSFSPNSTRLGAGGNNRITIITGPNSSGKSVFLKQTAIIVFLAQIGCFVPATRLILTPVEYIFVVSPSYETVSASLSHFGVELSMMSIALKEANSRSLVILDEFGQGTSPVDGSAIFISIMEYWMRQENNSPLILAATHLHGAATYLSRSELALNARFMSMRYTLQDGTLIFLYEPVDGLCGNSFPFSVAQASGMPEFVLQRGKEIHKIIEECRNLTPHPPLKNERKILLYRSTSEEFVQINPGNIDQLKQFIRRNVKANRETNSYSTPKN